MYARKKKERKYMYERTYAFEREHGNGSSIVERESKSFLAL